LRVSAGEPPLLAHLVEEVLGVVESSDLTAVGGGRDSQRVQPPSNGLAIAVTHATCLVDGMETDTRPARLPTSDLEAELRYYRDTWIRLSQALRRACRAWSASTATAASGRTGLTLGINRSGINRWSAGP
jgi:hypothetical protein